MGMTYKVQLTARVKRGQPIFGWATVLLTQDYEVAMRKVRRVTATGKACRFVKVNDLGEETSFEVGAKS